MIFRELLLNIALLLTVGLIYGYLIHFFKFSRRQHRLWTGVLFGLMAILVMISPVHQTPGVIYDSRSIVISIAGLFTGGIAAFTASIIASVYRLWVGGMGVYAGIATIFTSALAGAIAHRLWKRTQSYYNPNFLYLFGIIVSLLMLLCQFLIPWPASINIIKEIWIPVLLLYPLGTVLLGTMIADYENRQRLHEELKSREENLRITLDSIGDAVITTDRDGIVTRMNPVAETLTGWSNADASCKPLHDVFKIFNAKTRNPAENPVGKIIKTGQIVGLANDTVLISRGGSEYQIADSGAPIIDSSGHISGVVIVFRNVTESYKIEQQIRESEEKFRAAFTTSPDAVNLNRVSDGLYIDINEGFSNIMGYSREDAIGKTSLELNIWNNPQDRQRLVAGLKENGVVQNLEAEFKTKGGNTKIGLMSARVLELQGDQVVISVTRDITNYRRAQARFQEIWHSTQDGMCLSDSQGIITSTNPAFNRLFQMENSNPEGQSISQFYKNSEDERLEEYQQKFASKSFQKRFEQKFLLDSGDTHWFDVTNTFVEIPGEPEQLLATFRDITERKNAERALRESQERYSRIANTIPGALYDYIRWPDGNNKFLYITSQCEEIFEHDAETIINTPNLLWDLVHPDDVERLHEDDLRANRTGDLFQSEVRIVPPSGTIRWIQLTSRTSHVTKDGPAIWSGVILDITEQKAAEEALRESELRYRVLMETAPDLILTENMDGVIKYANSRVYSVLGFAPGSLTGQEITRLLPPEETALFQKRKTEITAGTAEAKLFNTAFIDSAGKRIPVEARISSMYREGKPEEIIVIGRDIREREKLESQLRQIQKMDAIGRLAGGIAHDFNNKLTVILGHVDFALMQVDQSKPIHNMLQIIKRAASDSAELTRQLLGFARQQTSAPQILNLNETVEGMLSILQRLITEDIELKWQPGSAVQPVNIDPGQIDQILTNLLVNAKAAIDGVGQITISTQNVSLSDESTRNQPGLYAGNYVMLTVSDTGRGMDAETRIQIFEPFFTTRSQGEGTGLGLATVYGIVKQNKGFIQVESEPGKGSTFKIYLAPVEEQSAHVTEKKKFEEIQTGSETILVVEDDSAILQLGGAILNRIGYSVLSANTASDALEIAKEHEDKIDLLLTDVIMPEMNGRELSDALLKIHPEMRLLFMSGYPADVIANQGVLDEGVHFLQKPFTMDSLSSKVREVLDK